MLLASLIAIAMPSQYESTALLAPPDQPTSYSSLLAATSASSAVGGLLGAKSSSQQNIVGILSTRTAQDEIIDRLDLRRVFHSNLYMDARAILASKTRMVVNAQTGFVSITVRDSDRNRARDLAQAYVDELNKLLTNQRNSAAHQERVFLENRLASLKVELDASSAALSRFSSHNATINPQAQGTALTDAAIRLQSDLMTAQSQLYALKAQYTDDNLRVRTAQARVAALQGDLQKMEASSGGDAKGNSGAGLPSLRDLPALGVTYTNLARTVAMQEGIYESLTKEYELAKVQEAKDTPAVRVLDLPVLAEKKSGPHRLMIVLTATLLASVLAIVLVILRKTWELMNDAYPPKAYLLLLLRDTRRALSLKRTSKVEQTQAS